MKSKTRLIAVLLAVMTVLAFATFAYAESGATVTVEKGQTQRFELYARKRDNWGAPDMSKRYTDFASITTGDEHIARIVDQYGLLQVVGMAVGTTTYEATTKDGITFTGTLTVIDSAPVLLGGGPAGREGGPRKARGWSGMGGWGADSWIAATGGGYKYSIEYFVAEPVPVTTYIYDRQTVNGTENESVEVNTVVSEVESKVYNSESYGRLSIRYRGGAPHDVTLSATGNIRIDEDGYFYKVGEAASSRPGYATKVWGGTITMDSPTLGITTVDVYLE